MGCCLALIKNKNRSQDAKKGKRMRRQAERNNVRLQLSRRTENGWPKCRRTCCANRVASRSVSLLDQDYVAKVALGDLRAITLTEVKECILFRSDLFSAVEVKHMWHPPDHQTQSSRKTASN